MQCTTLFSPTARVYNLRFLLVINVATLVCFVILASAFKSDLQLDLRFDPGVIIPFARGISFGLTSCAVIPVHQVIVLFAWRIRGLAAIDLAILTMETGVIGYLVRWYWIETPLFEFLIMQLVALALSALFRLATILKSKDKFFRQRFYFLGGCTPVDPPYRALSILLNRSLSRPLVRGESTVIIFARTLRQDYIPPPDSVNSVIYPFENATVSLAELYGATLGDVYIGNGEIQVYSNGNTICPAADLYAGEFQCPYGWANVRTLTISITLPSDMSGVDVTIHGYEYPSTPVLRGSNLFGVLTWTERREIQHNSRWSISPSYKTSWIPEITALQPYPSYTTPSDITTLTLSNRPLYPTRLLQETVDTTVLSGIANFGGFWSFVNGAFTLIFGANVLPLTPRLARRPLSALGFVHIFQRRSLVRQWHEDFPALHSEGGLPGSEEAGIVAFIRERLVDVGDDPRLNHESPNDLEAQTGSETLGSTGATDVDGEMREENQRTLHHAPDSSLTSRGSEYLVGAGYRLDDVPFPSMDTDVALTGVTNNQQTE
ncbi:hypothetical protein B0H13DRAFT_1908878 [Mycena leptocephala]|nr:hypothetical protein B0H13DRAFT_1908878 [Mycena leptocephala]